MLDRRQALQNLYNRVPSPLFAPLQPLCCNPSSKERQPCKLWTFVQRNSDTRMQRAEAKALNYFLNGYPSGLICDAKSVYCAPGPAIVRLLNVT